MSVLQLGIHGAPLLAGRGAVKPAPHSFQVQKSPRRSFERGYQRRCYHGQHSLSAVSCNRESRRLLTVCRAHSGGVQGKREPPCRLVRQQEQEADAAAPSSSWWSAPLAALTAASLLLGTATPFVSRASQEAGTALAAAAVETQQAATARAPSQNRNSEAPPLPSSFPPLRDVVLPEYKKVVLPNGLRLFLLEDHELGLVGGQLLVKGGSSLVPPEKLGLASLTASVQRSGGSKAHPADGLDQRLEVLGARVEVGTGVNAMQVNFRCLAEDLQEVFGLFTEVAQEPAMPQDKLELARSQLLEALARRNDEADDIAGRELPKLIYGANSIYARSATPATVQAVTKNDLVEFHRANFRPEKAVLGIWGDFDSAAIQALVEDALGSWQAAPSVISSIPPEEPPIPPPPPEDANTRVPVYLVDKPGLTQGYVRMGEIGVMINDPDVVALDVLNNVLNGFGGRLFNQVRSREGLAYSVYGGWSPAINHQGLFSSGGETRVPTLAAFVRSVRNVLDSTRQQSPSADELAKAKDAALNSFVFNFADSGVQLVRIMTFDLFGVDQDFLFRYKSGVEAVTGQEIMEAARRHLHPQSQKIVIVSDAKDAASQLDTLGVPIVPLVVD